MLVDVLFASMFHYVHCPTLIIFYLKFLFAHGVHYLHRLVLQFSYFCVCSLLCLPFHKKTDQFWLFKVNLSFLFKIIWIHVILLHAIMSAIKYKLSLLLRTTYLFSKLKWIRITLNFKISWIDFKKSKHNFFCVERME